MTDLMVILFHLNLEKVYCNWGDLFFCLYKNGFLLKKAKDT